MGGIIISLGGLLCLVGYIMILITAFKKSIGNGLLVLLLCGLGMLIFTFMNWSASKKAFMIWLAGFVLEMIGLVLGGASFINAMRAGGGAPA